VEKFLIYFLKEEITRLQKELGRRDGLYR